MSQCGSAAPARRDRPGPRWDWRSRGRISRSGLVNGVELVDDHALGGQPVPLGDLAQMLAWFGLRRSTDDSSALQGPNQVEDIGLGYLIVMPGADLNDLGVAQNLIGLALQLQSHLDVSASSNSSMGSSP